MPRISGTRIVGLDLGIVIRIPRRVVVSSSPAKETIMDSRRFVAGPLFCLFAIALAAATARAEDLKYVDLVRRIADLEHLSVLPQDGEKCSQWSSYDRASKYDEATGKYIHWDANGDGTGYIRDEGNQQVLAEMDGPGVIWRIWSADPQQGHVRIYLDSASEPAVDLPFKGYFDHKNAPFTRPHLVHEVSKGLNCYVPIPYQKSCKITADKNWGHYFHFTYGTFPAGTMVPTFKRDLTPEENAALDAADRTLADVGVDPAGKRPGEQTEHEDSVRRAGIDSAGDPSRRPECDHRDPREAGLAAFSGRPRFAPSAGAEDYLGRQSEPAVRRRSAIFRDRRRGEPIQVASAGIDPGRPMVLLLVHAV